jgi:hypothetical protein
MVEFSPEAKKGATIAFMAGIFIREAATASGIVEYVHCPYNGWLSDNRNLLSDSHLAPLKAFLQTTLNYQ